LRCLRGVGTLTAVGLVAEIGDITAFRHPKQLASYRDFSFRCSRSPV